MKGNLPFRLLRDSVRELLMRPYDRQWTIQGLGMLRTNWSHDNGTRIHIWDNRFKTPGVSTIHSHPWDFESVVMAGQFTNIVYDEAPYELAPRTHSMQTIKCGEGGGLVGEPELVALDGDQPMLMTPGHCYQQRANELHETYYSDGSVTLCRRTVRDGDGHHARVCWKASGRFVTAEPRIATAEEIEGVCQHALAAWEW
jgi:hypothetical protein